MAARFLARRSGRGWASFTLVEMLAAMVVLVLIMLIVTGVITQISKLWTRSSGTIGSFQSARVAFQSLASLLSQATLQTYYDYYPYAPAQPTGYIRNSNLQFVSGQGTSLIGSYLPSPDIAATHAVFFQAPLGYLSGSTLTGGSDASTLKAVNGLLNVCGFYVVFGSDASITTGLNLRPSFVNNENSPPPPRYRYRLMEVVEPSENFTVYNYNFNNSSSSPLNADNQTWIKDCFPSANAYAYSHVLAENVIGLVILPKINPTQDSTGTNIAPYYGYDTCAYQTNTPPYTSAIAASQNQLPPIIQVAIVCIDEPSAQRLAVRYGSNPPFGPGGLIDLTTLFSAANSLTNDLNQVENVLIASKINYHVFNVDVPIRTAQWSN